MPFPKVAAAFDSFSFVSGGCSSRRCWLAGLAAALLLAGSASWAWRAQAAHSRAPAQAGAAARGTALASADFDGDGVADLVSGWALSAGWGELRLQGGRAEESRGVGEKGSGGDAAPFGAEATVTAAPCAPDFLGAGDFNADGHADLVMGARGGNRLVWLAGDGRGGFALAGTSELPGGLTALAVGEVNRPDGLPDVVLGVATWEGAGAVLVMEGPNGAGRTQAEAFAVSAPVSGLALGALDGDALPDVAVTAGRELLLIAGRDRKLSLRAEEQATVRSAQLSVRHFPTALRAVALGDFTGDGRLDAVVLTAAGAVNIVRQPTAKKPDAWASWQAEEAAQGEVWAGVQGLVTARVAGLPVASILGLAGDGAMARMLKRETIEGATALSANGRLRLNATRWSETEISQAGATAAVLPLLINGDALDDLVVLRPGEATPVIVPNAPAAAVITVNSTADTNVRDNVITLREAILLANGELLKAALTPAEQVQVSGTPAPGLDEVRFNIQAGNTSEIGVASHLPPASQRAVVPQAPGDLDTSFLSGLTGPNGVVTAITAQASGKILIGGQFTSVNGTSRVGLARLNTDGSLDTTFNPGSGLTGSADLVRSIVEQPDGKILIGGNFSTVNGVPNNRLVRLNSDGGIDFTFSTGNGFNGQVNKLVLLADGRMYVVGSFSTYDGVQRSGIARLNADGTPDTSFANTGLGDGNALAVQTNGKIVFAYGFSLTRLNTDGSIDASFASGTGGGRLFSLALQPDGKILFVIPNTYAGFSGVGRLNSDGTADTTFVANTSFTGNCCGPKALLLQPDGKIIIGGDFTSVNGATRNGIARLNSGGSLDTSFNAGSGFAPTNGTPGGPDVRTIALQPDGSILSGGGFSSFNGTSRPFLARILGGAGACSYSVAPTSQSFSNIGGGGTITVTATAGCNWAASRNVSWIVFTSNPTGTGNGSFTFTVSANTGAARIGVIMVADQSIIITQSGPPPGPGEIDLNFLSGVPGPNNAVTAVTSQTDGKVIISGVFTTINDTPRVGLARLNTDGSLDATFNTNASIGGTSIGGAIANAGAIVIQPDGKILLGGDFTTVNGVGRNRIARLNTDGTFDNSFSIGNGFNGVVSAIKLLDNGQLYVVGSFSTYDGVQRSLIVRLNSNGTLDTSFTANVMSSGNVLAVQTNGKIIFSYGASLTRLNTDGSIDASFASGTVNGAINGLAIQPDGKILFAVASSYNGFTGVGRLNMDGTADPTFVGTVSGGNSGPKALLLQPDGKIVIGGDFTSVNGMTRNGIARLNSGGSLDASFNVGSGFSNKDVRTLALQADGKILVGGGFTSYSGTINPYLTRITGGSGGCSYSITPLSQNFPTFGGSGNIALTTTNSCNWSATSGATWIHLTGSSTGTGNANISFIVDSNTGTTPRTASITVADQSFTVTQEGPLLPGNLDLNFLSGVPGPNNTVTAVTSQPDGKILIGGVFSTINDTPRVGLARLNAGGSLDPTFNVNASIVGGGSTSVRAIMVQPDGKILLGGDFTTVNGVGRNRIARLNTDGTLDNSFSIGNGFNGVVSAIKLLDNGQLYAVGSFSTYNGVPRSGITRLNSDGILDTSFTANGISSGNALAVQANGKVVLAYGFSLTRLNTDGSIDAAFASGTGGGPINGLVIQPDMKILFTITSNYNGFNGVGRLNTDGTADPTFVGTASTVGNCCGPKALLLQPDGKILIGGNFTSVNGTTLNGLVRLNSGGSIDTGFNVGSGFSPPSQSGAGPDVRALAIQADGKILVGGGFQYYNGGIKPYLARLLTSTCDYALTPQTQNFPTNGDSGGFAIATEGTCSWTAVSNAPWITITGNPSGTGNGNVTFTVDVNPSPPRSATISVGPRNFTVTQDGGCTYSINPTIANVVAAGGNGFVRVTTGAGCPWMAQVSASSPWLRIVGSSAGTGTGQVSYEVDSNSGPERSGTVTIAGQTFTVLQNAGTGCSYSINPTSLSFTAGGGNGSVAITTSPGCPWMAVSNNSFLNITSGAMGSGNGAVNFTVQPNGGGSPRAGSLNISAGTAFSQNFIVVQGVNNANLRSITLNSPLPTILEPIIIDGAFANPGFNGAPVIEINGQNLTGADGHGLNITAGGSTLRSLILNRFANANRVAAVRLITNGGNVVEGCYIGTDAIGTGNFAPTNTNGLAAGVFMQSSVGNRIGGTTAAQRNLISGIDGRGVVMADSANNNLIQGNYIGTDITGSVSLGRQRIGVTAQNAAMGNTIGGTVAGAGNLISGNLDYGVFLQDDAPMNTVQGNNIGTNGAGVMPVSNGNAGVFLFRPGGSSMNTMNTIGGTTPAARNIISGNEPYGVVVGVGATATLVQGNYIGTNAAGTAALPNTFGITVTQATGSTIGGDPALAPNARNLISGNRLTGLFMGALNNGQVGIGQIGVLGATVQNNYIGTNAAGTAALANGRDGVFVEVQSVTNNVLNNRIAFNGGNGVRIPNVTDVPGTPAFRINIDSNEIYNNASLGIDLGDAGITPNDLGDIDGGANLQQNFPILQSANFAQRSSREAPEVANVTASLNSTPNTDFTVQWYLVRDCMGNQPVCTSEDLQMGNCRLGRVPVRTDGGGNVNFSFQVAFPPTFSTGKVTTLASEEIPSMPPARNTSEFSPCLAVTDGGAAGNAVVQFSSAAVSANEGDGAAIVTASRTGNTTSAVTIDYATTDGTAQQRTDYTITSGTLSFAAGETTKTFTVPIADDLYTESSESLTLTLANPSAGATLGTTTSATLTINDNDTVQPDSPAGNDFSRVFVARLNGGNEIPANSSTATGGGTVALNAAENQITVNLSFSGLSSAQTAAHIHGAAHVTANAPILFTLNNGTVTNQTLSVTPAQVAQLRAGLMYFNVHSANFTGGEIRGQIVASPVESARFFVRQQYADFLSRLPDQAGEDFWVGQIATVAGSDLNLIKLRRVAVSNAFFFEQEYQQTGAYTYRLYREAFGNTQPFPNPMGDLDSHPYCIANPTNCQLIRAANVPSFGKFAADRARLDAGNLAATQLALATQFAQRAEFVARYPASQTAEQYVDALIATIQTADGANLTSQRSALIGLYNGAGNSTAGRGAVLFRLAEDNAGGNPINNRAFIDAEYNRAFVTTQYFGYLRRDADMPGLNFWLSVVNQFPLRSATGQNGMVCAFITAAEYQVRFGPGVTRSNQSDCLSITGRITDGQNNGLVGINVTLSGALSRVVTSDAAGYYSFDGLTPGGNYTVVPGNPAYTFTPQRRDFVNVLNTQAANFTATPVSPPVPPQTGDLTGH